MTENFLYLGNSLDIQAEALKSPQNFNSKLKAAREKNPHIPGNARKAFSRFLNTDLQTKREEDKYSNS